MVNSYMKKIYFPLTLAAFATCFGGSAISFSEDRERPSRTASDGTQVVDYLAELESHVDSLERQVSGLQNEIAHKNELIGRQEQRTSQTHCDSSAQVAPLLADLKSARSQLAEQSDQIRGQQIRLKEQDQKISELRIAVDGESLAATRNLSLTRALQEKLEERDRLAESQATVLLKVQSERDALNRKIALTKNREQELESKISQLEAAVAESRQRGEQLVRVADSERKLQQSQAELRATIASQQESLARQQAYSRGLEEKLKQQADNFEQQLASVSRGHADQSDLKAQLVAAASRESDLQRQIGELSKAVAREGQINELLRAKQDRDDVQQQLVALSTHKKESQQPIAPQQMANLAPTTSREVRLRMTPSDGGVDVGLRQALTKMRGELDVMRAQYQRRERLFSEYRASRPALLVNPVRAVSRRGETLVELENALKDVKDSREAARIKGAIGDIKRVLDNDIKLIERLTRK